MNTDDHKPQCIDNGAPTLAATTLNRIERMGTMARLVFAQAKCSASGRMYFEEAAHVLVPTAILAEIAVLCAQGGVDITTAVVDVPAHLN